LLLLLPSGLLGPISARLELLGSGAETAPDLATALAGPWAINGGGPLPFPFAFGNGVNFPMSMVHNGVGALGSMLILLVLLTYNRWALRWPAVLLTTVLLACFGLAFEAPVIFLVLAWVVLASVYALRKRTLRFPAGLWLWLGISFAAGVLILLQGGVFSQLFFDLFSRSGSAPTDSYFTFQFPLAWPPVVISSHLGVLPLTQPATLLVALLETGPILLVLPLLVKQARQAHWRGNWFEAALLLSAFLSLGAIFLRYSGTAGISATTRLYFPALHIATLFAVPLAWNWGLERSETVKAALVSIGLIATFGGMVYFGAQLLAIRQPLASYYLTDLDVRVYDQYWDQLEPDALIFDPTPYRAVTIFGRFTDSSETWYVYKPEWWALRATPNPRALRAAGFDYAYVDFKYIERLDPGDRQALSEDCVELVEAWVITGPKDYRRLLDLRGCE
jgi:hypothetical protein